MTTIAHIKITSCVLPLQSGRGLGLSWLGFGMFGANVGLNAEPFVFGLWLEDRVNLSCVLSFPSVKRMVLVWKSSKTFSSFFVTFVTKWVVDGAGLALGGGAGASDISTSFLVDMIGYRRGGWGRSGNLGGGQGASVFCK